MQKKFHWALKAPALGMVNSPLLIEQKVVLLLGCLTTQAGSLMSYFATPKKNKLKRVSNLENATVRTHLHPRL